MAPERRDHLRFQGVSTLKITGLKTFLVGYYLDTFPGNFLLVKVSTDEGISGVGECYACGKALAIESAVRELERYLIGKDPLMIEHHWQTMDRLPFHSGWVLSCAMAGVEMALWDIKGKHYSAPVCSLMGGPTRDKVRVYADVFYVPTAQEAVAGLTCFVRKGYTAVKTEVHLSKEGHTLRDEELVKENVDMIRALRESFGEKVDIALDVGGALSPRNAIKLCQRLEPYQPLFIEEPARSDKIEALAKIAASTSIPIAAGERIYSPLGFRRLLEKQAVDIIQPDLSMTGFLSAIKIAAIAETYDVTVAPHTPLSYVQWAASVQFDACISNFAIQEVIPEGSVREPDPIRREIVLESIHVEKGTIKVPTKPGLGVELNEVVAERFPYRPFDRVLRVDEYGAIAGAL